MEVRRRLGLDASNRASWFQGLCAVMEWKFLLCEWDAIRSEEVALKVGSGSLAFRRGVEPGVLPVSACSQPTRRR